jgi:hypothetical protein
MKATKHCSAMMNVRISESPALVAFLAIVPKPEYSDKTRKQRNFFCLVEYKRIKLV